MEFKESSLFYIYDTTMSSKIKGTTHVRRRINQRLAKWEESKFQMLASSTVMYIEA